MFNFFRKKEKKIDLEKNKNELHNYGMNIFKRSYAAGKPSNANFGWGNNTSTQDHDIYTALERVRNKARSLSENDPIVSKYKQLLDSGVIGKDGFKLKVLGRDTENGQLDITANTAIQNAWTDFCKAKNCDLNKSRNMRNICSAIIVNTAIDGECLIRIVRGKSDDNSKYGIRLQLLPPELLDHLLNGEAPNGNYIRMGVEIDSYGIPVAYHIRKYSSKSLDWASGRYIGEFERVPASDMIHFYRKEAIEQTRGISWLSSVILDIKDLGQLKEACINAAKIGASSSIFLESKEGISIDKLADGYDEDSNQYYDEIGVGEIRKLPKGVEMKSFTPPFPDSSYSAFVKNAGQTIAAGLGLSPLRLLNDLEDLNFSTSRTVMADENYNFEVYQSLMIDLVMSRIYDEWLKQAMLNKKIFIKPNIPLPIESIDKFQEHRFFGRAFGYVDPSVEIETAIMEYKLGIKSLTEILAEQGRDLREVAAQYKQDFVEISKATGVEINGEDLIRKIFNGELL